MLRRRMLLISGSKPILPFEYQQILYIESTGAGTNSGGQYINTGITKAGFILNADLIIKGNTSSERSLCGTYGGGTSYLCNWNSSGFFDYGQSSNIWTPSTFVIGNRYTVVSTSTDSTSTSLSRPPWIFSQNEGRSYGYHSSSIQLFHITFTYLNEIIRDYYPCYRKSDGVAGLYDIINNTFNPNLSGGTDFIKGENYEGVL